MGFLSLFRKSRRSATHHTLPSALFPISERTISVSTWASSIQDLAESRDCRLRRIIHCKAKSGLRDNFLVIHVLHHPSGKNAVVLVDRDTSFGPSTGVADKDTDMPPSLSYSKMAVHALSVAPSRDCVRLSPDGMLPRCVSGGWAEIHTIKFRKASEAPSVVHLAALLTVVHRHVMPPGWSAEGRSGWFAYCVAEVMREIFLGKAKANKQWVRAPYGGMQVENRDTVDALIREFRSAWEDYSRRQTVRAGPTKRKPKHRELETKAQMDSSLADMLRTANL